LLLQILCATTCEKLSGQGLTFWDSTFGSIERGNTNQGNTPTVNAWGLKP
jgi:hypothetical protein